VAGSPGALRWCAIKFAWWAVLLLGAAPAGAEIYLLPADGDDLVGLTEKTVARFEDTLPDIARRYGLGFEEIRAANPQVDPWLPGDGVEVQLPTQHLLPDAPRAGIVINLPEHRLYYFPKPQPGKPRTVISHAISVGQMDWETPLGVTTIIHKRAKPVWYPPESIRRQHAAEGNPLPEAVPAGPDNPLGEYAMRLGIPGGAYLIHGTNRPVGVGMDVTHGCIRMYPENIESLYAMVPVGTKVTMINQPVRAGWSSGKLYLEVHPPMGDRKHQVDLTGLTRMLVAATRDRATRINWPLAEKTLNEARGIPIAISLPPLPR
jgi:L,D-transpeptidase ErfK/SrfK